MKKRKTTRYMNGKEPNLELARKIKDLRTQGFSLKDIRISLGVKQSQVHHYLYYKNQTRGFIWDKN